MVLNNHKISSSNFHIFLDDSVCAAAYNGKIAIGLTTMNTDQEDIFEIDRACEIKQGRFLPFISALKKAIFLYENKPEDTFEMEVSQTSTLNKLMATFSRYEDNEDSILQFRYKWNWFRDQKFKARVRKGVCTEIVQEDPWKWTKRGVMLPYESCLKLQSVAEQLLMGSYANSTTWAKTVSDFVSFGIENYEDLLRQKLEIGNKFQLRDKTKLIETILMAMVKGDPQYIEDEYRVKTELTTLVAKETLIFALFKLRL